MARVISVSISVSNSERPRTTGEKSSPKSRGEHSLPAKKPRVVQAMTTKLYREFNFRHKFSLWLWVRVKAGNIFCPTNSRKQSYRVRGEKKYSHSLVLQSMARLVRKLDKIPWEKHPVKRLLQRDQKNRLVM